MAVLEFFSGLSIGLVLLWRQRSRSNARLEELAHKLRPDIKDSPFSSTSYSYAPSDRTSAETSATPRAAT
ncbi:MAG: hypothetical protein HC772_12720 [Leptolyngbyaceae cyanobacterium CRU_2_3]|nr:hypothetical protein [Leptolyngbyaceae cyanobacterium CRU_2_3]